MGTLTPKQNDASLIEHTSRKLRKVNRENRVFRETVEQLNRFVDAVASLAPDIAERAALAAE